MQKYNSPVSNIDYLLLEAYINSILNNSKRIFSVYSISFFNTNNTILKNSYGPGAPVSAQNPRIKPL